MAPDTKESVMSLEKSTPSKPEETEENFLASYDTRCRDATNSLTSRDMDVTPRRSPDPRILPSPSGGPAAADVTIISNGDLHMSTVAENQIFNLPANAAHAPHLVDCRTLTPMQLRTKYRREETSHRNMKIVGR